MKLKEFFNSEKLKKALPWVGLIVFVLIIGFTVKEHFAQQRKLDELVRERERLQTQVEELSREQERLESNLEYVKSREGLLWYAREFLGYVGPDDILVEPND